MGESHSDRFPFFFGATSCSRFRERMTLDNKHHTGYSCIFEDFNRRCCYQTISS